MRILARLPILIGFLSTLAILFLSSPVYAQKGRPETVPTVDGVGLSGFWYPGNQKSPAVILLHALGEDCSKREWVQLAETLNSAGYAVLRFDFRGHGDSTKFNPQLFYSRFPNHFGANSMANAGPEGPLDVNKFPSRYLPYLVNDIAACRAFLEQEHALGRCNAGAVLLIGAEEGAALGSIYLKSEWFRFRFKEPGIGVVPGPDYNNPSGKEILASIWLSFSHQLKAPKDRATFKTSPIRLLNYPAAKGTPMVFVANGEDRTDKYIAVESEKKLKNKSNQQFFGKFLVDNAQKLKGRELLQPNLGLDKQIARWIEKVVNHAQKKGGLGWAQRDFRMDTYVWATSQNQFQPAKPKNELNFLFSSYSRFMP